MTKWGGSSSGVSCFACSRAVAGVMFVYNERHSRHDALRCRLALSPSSSLRGALLLLETAQHGDHVQDDDDDDRHHSLNHQVRASAQELEESSRTGTGVYSHRDHRRAAGL